MAHNITYTDDSGQKIMKVAGTIRRNTAVSPDWLVIDDAGHDPSYLAVGDVTDTYIQVTYPTALQVVSFVVAPDDTFAGAYTINFGASVGLSHAFIRGRLNGGSFNPSTWSNAQANIWISGEFLVE